MIQENLLRKEKINKRDKTASLLALTLGKDPAVPCPSDEELASLIDGKCTIAENERMLSHLADCDHCYGLWYSLKSENEIQRAGGKVYCMKRRRNLAFAGSILAVAASVLIFINTAREPLTGNIKEREEIAVEADDGGKELSVVPLSIGVDEKNPGEKKGLRMLPAPVAAERMMKAELPKKTGKAGAGKAGSIAGTVAESAVALPSVSPLQGWLSSVSAGCRDGRKEESFWRKQFVNGEQLQTVSPEETVLLLRVLALLPEKFDKKSIKNQCDKIFTVLVREEKSR
jgi:hypothetical protein